MRVANIYVRLQNMQEEKMIHLQLLGSHCFAETVVKPVIRDRSRDLKFVVS